MIATIVIAIINCSHGIAMITTIITAIIVAMIVAIIATMG